MEKNGEKWRKMEEEEAHLKRIDQRQKPDPFIITLFGH